MTCRRRSSCAAAGSLRMSTCFIPANWGCHGQFQLHSGRINSFNVNEADLAFILKQIKVAEAETLAVQGGATAQAALQAIIGPNAAILPMGLRHVDGTNNNLLPGGEKLGAADTVLPRLA